MQVSVYISDVHAGDFVVETSDSCVLRTHDYIAGSTIGYALAVSRECYDCVVCHCLWSVNVIQQWHTML